MTKSKGTEAQPKKLWRPLICTHRLQKVNFLSTPLNSKFHIWTPITVDYPNIRVVWDRFYNIFKTVDDFFTHIEVYKTHLWCVLNEFYDDQVMYIEFRSSIKTPYNSTGHVYSKLETMAIIIDVVNEFKKLNPHFIGVKYIYSVSRRDSAANIQEKLDTYNQLR